MSLLAVAGGLLWWQRPGTPVDIPRPQDEAAIMHAILERHYAMGRTNTKFVSVNLKTNTIGFVPAATAQFPDLVRSAILPANTVPKIYWLVPNNVFFESGSWDGSYPNYTTASNKVLNAETIWWTNRVTLATGEFYSTTNYSTTNIVFTNGWFVPVGGSNLVFTNGWVTNVLWSSIRYTNTTTIDVQSNGLFAFERDRSPFAWSTSVYNDMSRALSAMQWQKSELPLWDTNATNGTFRLFHDWYVNSRNITNDQYELTFNPNQFYAGHAFCTWNVLEYVGYGVDRGLRLEMYMNIGTSFMTNSSAFVYANVQPVADRATTNSEGVHRVNLAWSNDPPWLSTILSNNAGGWARVSTNVFSLNPGKGRSISLGNGDYNATRAAIIAYEAAFFAAEKAALISASTPVGFYYGTDDGTNVPPWFAGVRLPGYYITWDSLLETHRVVFQSITNYLPHAPAR